MRVGKAGIDMGNRGAMMTCHPGGVQPSVQSTKLLKILSVPYFC